MIHYDELIKAEKMGYFSDYETLLFARAKSEIKSVTGVLPLTFTAKGGAAADWVIEGNAQGVGERTENLWDFTTQPLSGTGYLYYGNINLLAGTYTLRADLISNNANMSFAVVDSQGNTVINTNIFSHNSRTFTSDYNITKLRFYVDSTVDELYLTLTKGSIPPSGYIPYGYQIPLTVSQQGQPDKTVDIYIGDSPLTEGETVSKTSTGVDIELFEGENTVSTTLYNKPEMKIDYK